MLIAFWACALNLPPFAFTWVNCPLGLCGVVPTINSRHRALLSRVGARRGKSFVARRLAQQKGSGVNTKQQ